MSILDTTKKSLGLTADYDEFDPEIIMYINSAFSTLHQLGIGPFEGFMITDNTTTWDTLLLGDERLNSVKQLVSMMVKLVFDPPTTSFGITAIEKMIAELQWRLNVTREYAIYGTTAPEDGSLPNPDLIVIDGGEA